jgi:spoIIIJ-associated protein
MEWVETTGKTVEEALDAALDQLGVDEDEAEFEVLQEPKSGFLGRKDARIRARVRPVSREKPGERRRRQPRKQGARGGRRDDRGRRRGDKPAVAVADRDEAGGGGDSQGDGAERSGAPKRRRRRGGRGRGGSRSGGERSGGNGSGPSREAPAAREGDEGAAVSEPSVSVEEQAEVATDFTRGLVEAFGVDASVDTRTEDEDVLIVDITGQDLGLLVGPKGATLHAIEELVRTVVQRQTEGHGARIHVDVGGYRAKRREALERFAREQAEKVKESGEDLELEPMSASDRKVVHDAVAELDGVTTTSEGEEPRRRVVLRAG